MNIMQNNLQQAFKEYTDLKNYILEDSKNTEDLRKKVSEESDYLENIEQKADLLFEKLGYKSLLQLDLIEKKKELYYLYLAYRDLIEIPDEIKDELEDYKINSVFTIISGEKKLINKDIYDSYKKQSIEWSVATEKYNKIIENGGA